jgi:cyclophilin family peptidyl-prolyl cis-trans isomerase
MLYQPGAIILGKYRIDRFIGKGASAEVYLATHLELKAPRSLKILSRDLPGVGSTAFGDYRQRFELEAQLGARINNSNVIQVYDFHQDEDSLVLVMEYAAGGSLAGRIAKARETGQPVPVEEAVRIAGDTAQGLSAVHALDCVHRDLKPTNILLDAQGRAKVADLGLAQIPGGPSQRSVLSQPLAHPGTPAYMSPEQATTSQHLTPASDIYALGCVLFELLTGRLHRNARPGTRASSLRPDVPPWLDDLIARMVETDPGKRPWDGAEVVGILAEEQQRQAALRAVAEEERRQAGARQAREAERKLAEARAADEEDRRQTAIRRAGEEARLRDERDTAEAVTRAEEEARRQQEAPALAAREAPEPPASKPRSWTGASLVAGAVVLLAIVVSVGSSMMPAAPAAAPVAPATIPTSRATPVPASTQLASVTPSGRKTYVSLPPQTVDAVKIYTATIVTDKGTMVFTLLPKAAPVTVNSFVFLARQGFYNGLAFHRVEPGFVIQGGDPRGDGTGGPGYSLPAEFTATKHITGTLAMARTSDPNSAGSQFYVTLAPVPSLDNQYTVFGQIVSGMDVALRIAKGDVMRQVTVEEK